MNDLLEQVAEPQPNSIRLIPLTQGQYAIVDAVDYERISQWKWFADYDKTCDIFYAKRRVNVNGKISHRRMHREVLPCDAPQIDHRDGNGLNNRRSNLRPCTSAQNTYNTKSRLHGKSIFKGISPLERGRWRATICVSYKKHHLGCYGTQEDAARAYDAAAKKYFGEFARLNFPNEL